jgi:hypothetical protein
MIMRFRPANISLINRRHYLPRLLLILSLKDNDKNNPSDLQILTGHTISTSGLSTTRSRASLDEASFLSSAEVRGSEFRVG